MTSLPTLIQEELDGLANELIAFEETCPEEDKPMKRAVLVLKAVRESLTRISHATLKAVELEERPVWVLPHSGEKVHWYWNDARERQAELGKEEWTAIREAWEKLLSLAKELSEYTQYLSTAQQEHLAEIRADIERLKKL